MKRPKLKCPPNWHGGCRCNVVGLEPNEDCPIHGYPNPMVCPYCGQFFRNECKRCGYQLSREVVFEGK